MPTYEFRCTNGHTFDQFHKISDAPKTATCPVCGAEAVRAISGGAGLVFKGSGFYLTDYGKNAHRTSGTAPAKGGEGGGEAKSGGESKSEGGSSAKDAGSKGSDARSGDSSAGKSSGARDGGSSGGSASGGSTSGGSTSGGSTSGGSTSGGSSNAA